jgi:hypothetical protein
LVVLTVLGGAASADVFDAAFPPPDWERHTHNHGFYLKCVAEGCGGSGGVSFMSSSPEMTAFDRIGAEKFFTSAIRASGVEPKFLKFTVDQDDLPGWTMVLERQLEGKLYSEVWASRKIEKRRFQNAYPSARDEYVIFGSAAMSVEAAQRNFDKFVDAFLATTDNLNKGR